MTNSATSGRLQPIKLLSSLFSIHLHQKCDYEYIDVLMKDSNGGGDETVRLIVAMDFKSQFELARPTSTYLELTASLPSIFVGSEEKLMEIICLVCLANSINNFLKITQRWNLDLVVLFSYCQI
ncbi:unnamed protein product [Camellia sinensis]